MRRLRDPWPLAAGAAVLLVPPAWGIAFDALKQLATTAQPAPVALWLAGHPEVARPQALRTLDSSGA